MPDHIIYSITHGWFSRGGTYTSDWQQAKRFTKMDAIQVCQQHISPDGEPEWIPVDIVSLGAVVTP